MSTKSRLIVVGIVTGAVLLGGAALVALGNNGARDQATHERDELRAAIAKYDARFVADQKLVASSSIAAIVLPSARSAKDEHDAGAFLASRFPTVTSEDAQSAPKSAVPPAVAKAINAWNFDKYLQKHGTHEIDAAHTDTSWMKELARFDAWDFDDTPAMKKARPVDVRDAPTPRIADAPAWATTRALQAIEDGDFAHAGPELDDLARLLVSTETELGALYAVNVLHIERVAFDYANEKGPHAGHVDAGPWTPPDAAAVDAFGRIVRASPAYFSLHADPSTIDRLVAQNLVADRCAAVGRAATNLITLEPIVGDLYADMHAAVARALAASSSQCRLHLVREAFDHPQQTALVSGVDALCVPRDGDCVAVSIASHVPGAAQGMFDAMYTGNADDALAAAYAHTR